MPHPSRSVAMQDTVLPQRAHTACPACVLIKKQSGSYYENPGKFPCKRNIIQEWNLKIGGWKLVLVTPCSQEYTSTCELYIIQRLSVRHDLHLGK
jgi:hypothetical protein